MVRCFPKPSDAEKKTQMAGETVKGSTGEKQIRHRGCYIIIQKANGEEEN